MEWRSRRISTKVAGEGGGGRTYNGIPRRSPGKKAVDTMMRSVVCFLGRDLRACVSKWKQGRGVGPALAPWDSSVSRYLII